MLLVMQVHSHLMMVMLCVQQMPPLFVAAGITTAACCCMPRLVCFAGILQTLPQDDHI
jgi:hypothetical protein